jgi:hypothetical protein
MYMYTNKDVKRDTFLNIAEENAVGIKGGGWLPLRLIRERLILNWYISIGDMHRLLWDHFMKMKI